MATQKKRTTSTTDTGSSSFNVSSESTSVSGTNYIKMDGEYDSFEGGAVRFTKTGKGRFDLIPNEIIKRIIDHVYEYYYADGSMTSTTKADIIIYAYEPFCLEIRALDTIISLINYEFVKSPESLEYNQTSSLHTVETTFEQFIMGLCNMLKQLAIHYENGAEKYGVDNWKKGIPCTGGDRGGSFLDSGLRHLNQYLLGEKDEPHAIACIWNFIGILWNIYHGKYDDK